MPIAVQEDWRAARPADLDDDVPESVQERRPANTGPPLTQAAVHDVRAKPESEHPQRKGPRSTALASVVPKPAST